MAGREMTPPYYDAARVEELLDYRGCIDVVRSAMIALSTGGQPQPLRQIVAVGPGRLFGVMPGAVGALSTFGAKLASVFEDPDRPGSSRHRGVVVAYDGQSGSVRCIADAEPITVVRTACASAAATDALARRDARTLAVFGTGAQAHAHVRAISLIRPLHEVLIWGRSPAKARALSERLSRELQITVRPVDQRTAAAADIVCTVSAAHEPILFGEWVNEGTHVNLVGSSHLGPVEIDVPLLIAGRYIADYRPSVLAQAAELAVARAAGVVDDSHVVGDIGQVFAGEIPGRQDAAQITIYKSLGNVAQDLAAALYVHRRATSVSNA
jgi:ornithine cyclodeaminase